MRMPPYGRQPSSDIMKDLLLQKERPNMYELGTMRIENNWQGDGYSTALFAWIAAQTDGYFFSVDIDPKCKELAEKVLRDHDLIRPQTHILTRDAIEFLHERCDIRPNLTGSQIVDFVYFDAWDYDNHNAPAGWEGRGPELSEIKHLEAFEIVDPCIPSGGIIAIDDILDTEKFVGKGARIIPHALSNGYEWIYRGYQCILQKR